MRRQGARFFTSMGWRLRAPSAEALAELVIDQHLAILENSG